MEPSFDFGESITPAASLEVGSMTVQWGDTGKIVSY